MKKIISFLCCAFDFFMLAENVFSFKPGLPGWTKNNRMVSFDPTVKVSETGSLKLSGKGSASRTIQLEKDAEYEVSVYIKAENVTGGNFKGVLLRLTDGNGYFAVTGDPKNMPRQRSCRIQDTSTALHRTYLLLFRNCHS